MHTLGELTGGDLAWVYLYPFVFQKIPIPPGKILDLGSNDARFARWLKSQHITQDVISLDIRDIRILGENFIRGTAKHLPFRDNAFTSLVSLFSLPMFCGNNVSEEQIFNEMARVTKAQIIIWPVPLGRWTNQKVLDQSTDSQINSDILKRAKTLTDDRWKAKIVDLSLPGSSYNHLIKALIIDKE